MSAQHLTANEITAQLLVEIPRQFSNIRVWRNNRVEATVIGKGGKPRRVSAGIDGQGDIEGIVGQTEKDPLGGRMLQIEVKAYNDYLRQSQIAFAAMIRKHGGIYLVCREDIEGFLSALKGAI